MYDGPVASPHAAMIAEASVSETTTSNFDNEGRIPMKPKVNIGNRPHALYSRALFTESRTHLQEDSKTMLQRYDKVRNVHEWRLACGIGISIGAGRLCADCTRRSPLYDAITGRGSSDWRVAAWPPTRSCASRPAGPAVTGGSDAGGGRAWGA